MKFAIMLGAVSTVGRENTCSLFIKRLFHLPKHMKCLQINKYSSTLEELQCQYETPCPDLKFMQPNQALVRVHAASINPFDIEMSRGYGRNAINLLRSYSPNSNEFPLILGRDFSGVIVKRGRLFKRFKEGDSVYGVRWVVGQGTHAEYVIVNKSEISPKPNNLTHTEAASIPYVACTSWSALINSGAVPIRGSRKLSIFIPGGTGGIGSFAVQLCKAYGHNVVTSCATDGIPLLDSISIPNALDYTAQTYEDDLKSTGPFDVILDTQNERFNDLYKSILRKCAKSKYVSLRPTLLPDTDQKGIALGLLNAGAKYASSSIDQLTHGQGKYQWGFFKPDGVVLDHLKNFVEAGVVKPLVDKVFSIDDILEAYKYVEKGHARGKTVLQMVSNCY